MMAAMTTAMVCAGVLALIAGVHFYWALGGDRGKSLAIPVSEQGRAVLKPRPGATHAVGVALLVAGAFILARGGVIGVPAGPGPLAAAADGAIRTVVGLLALVFLVRALGWFRYTGFFKQVRDTSFGRYDTWLYCPLCLLLGLALASLVLG